MKAYLLEWNYKRLIQLGFGLYFFWEYTQHPALFSLLFGGLMSFQAIFNVGCFSTRGCNPNIDHKQKEQFSEDDTVEYEEIE